MDYYITKYNIKLDDLEDILEDEDIEKQRVCTHEFIPLFNSISCKYCGLNKKDFEKQKEKEKC